MASGTSSERSLIVPLNGSNFATWKIQCKMALLKDNLWSIVNGIEVSPSVSETTKLAEFNLRKDKALATIVLSVHPSLLYLLGDPTDPKTVWKALEGQFQRKTWANKLALKRQMNSLQLNEGDSTQSHIKAMTEIFSELAIIGEPMEDEDKSCYSFG